MTEAQDSTDRKSKWMRYIALALALIWAVYWTWLYQQLWVDLPSSFSVARPDFESWQVMAAMVLTPWVAAAIPWRWERAGAVLLLIASVLLPFIGLRIGSTLNSLDARNNAFLIIVLSWPGDITGFGAAILLLVRWWKSRTSEGPEASELELPGLGAIDSRFTDFSPMPEEFADFERMLEEAKEKSGTLICYDCGHDNPIGQTNCEGCGAWMPQTAKARWAYGKDK